MKHIPNILTLGNLVCGLLGITFLFENNLTSSALMIFLGSVFDFLDGFTARKLNVKSNLGKQLDSLSDLVTFGVLPSLILYKLALNQTNEWISYLTLIIALGAAIRLAKFNIDDSQANYFIGLPTPAMALMVGSLPFIISEEHVTGSFNIYTIIGLSIFLTLLMISSLKLMAFKFSHFRWKTNESKYILILLSLILVFYLSFLAIPVIFTLYLLFSLFGKYPESSQNG